jgi:hypothetical protein
VRVLLDTKDLIEVVERSRPLDVLALGTWLQQRGARIVLTFTGVSDFVGPVFADRGDWLTMRGYLQGLEALPIAYMREGLIIRDELELALRAYKIGQEPDPVDPYVSRWDETADWGGKAAATQILVGLRLDEIVHMARNVIQVAYKRHTPALRDHLNWQRQLPSSQRLPLRDIFVNAVPARLKAYNLSDANAVNLTAFGQWLWRRPSRSPGLRLQFETYHQLRRDNAMVMQEGDIADFAHITALPYVHYATVDKRIGDFLGKVLRKLGQNQSSPFLSARVFTRLEDLLAQVP